MDISVAHVIETVRLAQATAALRNLPYPSLNEYNEAVTTVMGFGDDILLQIIREELIISNRLGSVPDNVPKVPLLVDVEKTQKSLRVPFTAEIKELILDLRKPNDLERSIFFHRLQLLGIDWAIHGEIDGKGTFKEQWTLYHKPEQIIDIIERAIWGNTVMEATQKYLQATMEEICHIPELTALLNGVLPADLPALVETMTVRLDALSDDKKPSACIGCKKCTRICPQDIDVPEAMKGLSEELAKLPSWAEICRQREEAAKAIKSD